MMSYLLSRKPFNLLTFALTWYCITILIITVDEETYCIKYTSGRMIRWSTILLFVLFKRCSWFNVTAIEWKWNCRHVNLSAFRIYTYLLTHLLFAFSFSVSLCIPVDIVKTTTCQQAATIFVAYCPKKREVTTRVLIKLLHSVKYKRNLNNPERRWNL